MAAFLVRPYPVDRLAGAGEAVQKAIAGDYEGLFHLTVSARDALEDLDPDEVRLPVLDHLQAGERDKAALRAAVEVAETWEGVVAIGASIPTLPRFRGFVLACAAVRYLDIEPDLEAFKAWCRGEDLPGLSADDTALYAALPALLGLGPELPDEVSGQCPVQGDPVWSILGLPDEDWEGADPLDGMAIDAEACSGAFAGATPAWREVLARGAAAGGLLVRRD